MEKNNLKIISGIARGKKLRSLKGLDTRPTSHRVKESLMNIIQFEIEGATIADLYAGTGQLGIESLSRGAHRATFVDNSRESCQLIRENLLSSGFKNGFNIVQQDTVMWLKATSEKFNIVFVDPPYHHDIINQIMPFIAKIMTPDGVIICESEGASNILDTFLEYNLHKEYTYGKRKISVFRQLDKWE